MGPIKVRHIFKLLVFFIGKWYYVLLNYPRDRSLTPVVFVQSDYNVYLVADVGARFDMEKTSQFSS